MGLSPAQKVGAVVEGDVDAHLFPYIEALARLSSLKRVDQLPASPAPVAVLDRFRLMLEVEIDVAAERARIGKDRARVEGELAKVRAQLANERFVAKAPPAVVEEMRARLARLEAELAKLTEQVQRLTV